MTLSRVLFFVARSLSRYCRCVRGGATALAASFVTIMTLGGSALIIDHQWLSDQADLLKSASDSAAIASTQVFQDLIDSGFSVSESVVDARLKSVARRYVLGNFAHLPLDRYTKFVDSLHIDVIPDRSQRRVRVKVTANLGGTLLSKHLSFVDSDLDSMSLVVESVVDTVITPLEIVLAIDVSNSMVYLLDGGPPCEGDLCFSWAHPSNSRMEIVRRSAHLLVDLLEPDPVDRIAIGIVPWHSTVRLDPSLARVWETSGSAIYPSARSYGVPYGCDGSVCTDPPPVVHSFPSTAPGPWVGCLDSHRVAGSGSPARLPDISSAFDLPVSMRFAQAFSPARYGARHHCLEPPYLPSDFSWQICYAGDDYSKSGMSPDPASHPQRGCEPGFAPILPLSTDGSEVRSAIDALTPVGASTYSALALLWSQRLLEHRWSSDWGATGVHPVDPAAVSGEGFRKVVVLMTDGEDSYCGFGNHSCDSSPLGHSRSAACDAVKARGTDVFVVAAMDPLSITSALGDSLRSCSSESADSSIQYAFLNNSSPSDLEAAFVSIAEQLRIIRRVQ